MNSDDLELASDRAQLKLYKDFAMGWTGFTVLFVMAWILKFNVPVFVSWFFAVASLMSLTVTWTAIWIGLQYKRRVEAGEKLRADYALLRRRWPAKIPCPTFAEFKRG